MRSKLLSVAALTVAIAGMTPVAVAAQDDVFDECVAECQANGNMYCKSYCATRGPGDPGAPKGKGGDPMLPPGPTTPPCNTAQTRLCGADRY